MVSIAITATDAMISQPYNSRIRRDFSDAPWEEMESEIAKEGNMDLNALAVMTLAGVIAAVGIVTNSLHVVIAAMLVAPGFEPILRVSLATISQRPSWRNGLADTAKGYAALILGAAAAALMLQVPGSLAIDTSSSYLPLGVLVSYWTTLSATSVMVPCETSFNRQRMIAQR